MAVASTLPSSWAGRSCVRDPKENHSGAGPGRCSALAGHQAVWLQLYGWSTQTHSITASVHVLSMCLTHGITGDMTLLPELVSRMGLFC